MKNAYDSVGGFSSNCNRSFPEPPSVDETIYAIYWKTQSTFNMKKYLTIILLSLSMVYANAIEVEVKSTLVDYPTFQGVVTMPNLTTVGCWNAVARYLYSAFNRSIYEDITEGANFTTKNLRTTITYKDGNQIVYDYSISFEFREGRFRYTFYVNNYHFDKGSNLGTENFKERPTSKSEIIQEMNGDFIERMNNVGKFAYDEDW